MSAGVPGYSSGFGKAMNNAERAKEEFDRIMRKTEDRERRAKDLQGVERFDQLFKEAERRGIDQKTAWLIVERDPSDLKSGVLALIDEVRKDRIEGFRKEFA
jgi:hypothetical protein